MLMLPSDPAILLSLINTRLRDDYASLDDCCESLGMDRSALEEKLGEIGFRYDPLQNRFR